MSRNFKDQSELLNSHFEHHVTEVGQSKSHLIPTKDPRKLDAGILILDVVVVLERVPPIQYVCP